MTTQAATPVDLQILSQPVLPDFPKTRYQGSKRKILGELSQLLLGIEFDSALDLFTGTASVTLLLRLMGKSVTANDFLRYNQNTARLFGGVERSFFQQKDFRSQLRFLLLEAPLKSAPLVTEHYRGVFFKEHENTEIDRFCQNLTELEPTIRSLFIYAVGQALLKKRPYNLFHRANLDMRTREVKRSFGNQVTWEVSILDHALKCIQELQAFPFPRNSDITVTDVNTANLSALPSGIDLIYADPPYLNARGNATDYSAFYGFLDGLCDYDLFAEGDSGYPHKPIRKMSSRWSRRESAIEELEAMCAKWPQSVIVLSYRSDGVPTLDEATHALSSHSRTVEIHTCGEYKYALSKNDTSEEIFVVSRPKLTEKMPSER